MSSSYSDQRRDYHGRTHSPRRDRRRDRDEYGREPRDRRPYHEHPRADSRRRLPEQRGRDDRRDRPHSRFGGYGPGHGGPGDAEVLAERWKQREAKEFSIWPPSPTVSEDELDRKEEEKVIAKAQGRFDDVADISGDSSDSLSDAESRAQSGESDSAGRDSSRRSKSKRSRHSSRSKQRSTTGGSSRRHRSSKHSSSRRSRSKREHRKRRRHEGDSDSEDDKRQGGAPPDAGVSRERSGGEESDQEVGPVPSREHVPPLWERSRGGGSVPGEGPSSSSSRAGERLLGRGEFGLDHGRIERLEGAGYVMSGNRHRRANPAVRVPKDGQAITADEKRQILMQNQEERQKKETQVIAEFREMLSKKR